MFLDHIVNDPEKAKNLFRYKGVIAAKGMSSKFVFQGVHMICDAGFAKDIHYIGRKLNKTLLFKGLNACMAEENLRFDVDNLVKVKVKNGKWVSGIITKQWDEGNCYQVKLDDKKNSLVHAPIDSDQ